MNNKVSEKAIWEGSISPDNDTSSWASHNQSQPQMMFCYKCNQVIPGNSTFCPYCQVKLFTECPKCGAKYSSQYPACSQCGTNREGYLRAQRQEQERKRVIEAENRRQREIAEQKKIEEERRRKEAEEERERQERFKRYQQEANERQQKEAYLKENAEIMKTKEYETAYSLLNKAFDDYEEGIYTANEFVERKTKHNAIIESCQKQISELENSMPEKEEYEDMVIMLSEALEYLNDDDIDAEIKNEYLKRIIDKVEFSREIDDEFILDVFLK